MNFLDQFKSARKAAAPIVIICTADYTTAQVAIKDYYADKNTPIVHWDICRGITADNELGRSGAAACNKSQIPGQPPAMVTGNPVEALQRALTYLPERTILFMENLQIILEDRDSNRISVIQGIWNMRDPFKATKRTLVLFVPDITVPAELSNDIVRIDVPLPTAIELAGIARNLFRDANLQIPPDEQLQLMVNAVSGLSEFMAENSLARSLSPEGIDYESLWDQKCTAIKQIAGLSVERRKVRFADLGGLYQAKKLLMMILQGKYCPSLVVLIDEIDRQLSGINDSSGVGGDAYQQVLSGMQDNGWDGALFPGFAGTGKTELAHAMGSEAGGLFLKLDLGGMQDKFVGESQKKIRAAIKMLKAMGGERVFFIGTTNRAEAIRPELKRRFSYGTFFFDLLGKDEQAPIWDIYHRVFNIQKQPLPSCSDWTGAEIKACCKRADELGVSLVEAAKFISPVARTMGDGVLALRKSAHNRYLSASREGFYDMNDPITDTAVDEIRRIGNE